MNQVIYGIHTVQTLLKVNPDGFLVVFLLESRNDIRFRRLTEQLNKKNITIELVSKKWLNNNVGNVIHQGVVAYVKRSKKLNEDDLLILLENKLKENIDPFLLILDEITDPHNLGACLRCAGAAGIHAVIISKHRTAPLNAVVRKISTGVSDIVPVIYVTNLSNAISLLRKRNIRIIGTTEDSNNYLYQTKLTGPLAMVFGSEKNGIRQLIRRNCDEIVSIPTSRSVLSLNVSVATGICLFEAVRQRTA